MTLLDNRTWAKHGIAEEFDYIGHSQAWQHPQVNVFVTLVLFIVMKVSGVRAGRRRPGLPPGQSQVQVPQIRSYLLNKKFALEKGGENVHFHLFGGKNISWWFRILHLSCGGMLCVCVCVLASKDECSFSQW